eukprot:TRINITY_DN2965_c1_g1_i1.p1 TRINITY_DN2965_c1_g1~~TRINITY_DN2965_c1_g1_i1.p1  ORF type:complete len:165 (-),score=30.36 TRINITY_DN2965_c1_g1_i1:231-725(-)
MLVCNILHTQTKMSLALFTVGNYWTADANSNALVMADAEVGKLLAADLGISRELYSVEQALAVVKAPDTKFGEYKKKVEALLTAAAPKVKTDIVKLINMGFTPEEADKYAKEKAAGSVLLEKKLLDLEYSGLMNNTDTLLSATAKVDLRTKAPKASKKAPKIEG